MLAYRVLAHAGVPMLVAERPHVVTIDGTEFVARCGIRWERRGNTGILPDSYTGKICQACDEAVTP